MVINEDEIGDRKSLLKEISKLNPNNSNSENSKIKIGFNCIGGNSAINLIKFMGENSKVITYGGMSKKGLTVSTSSLIFDNISYYGFWLTKWNNNVLNKQKRKDMINQLVTIMKSGKLISSVENHKFSDLKSALSRSQSGFRQKVLLRFDD